MDVNGMLSMVDPIIWMVLFISLSLFALHIFLHITPFDLSWHCHVNLSFVVTVKVFHRSCHVVFLRF